MTNVKSVAPGISVEVSGDVRVLTRRPATAAALMAAPADTPVSPVRIGLAKAGFEVAADIMLTASPGAALVGEGPPTVSKITVQTQPGEHAVVLLERKGGVYAWIYPSPTAAAAPGFAVDQGSTLEFDLQARAAPADGLALDFALPFDISGIFQWVASELGDGVKALVLKFLVAKGEDALVEMLDGSRPVGLTSLAADDANAWTPDAGVAPPIDKGKKKVLLMVHGTFSNTKGSFGPLIKTKAGQAFLASARSAYGGVIGFDHRTLKDSVADNAQAMVDAIKALNLPDGTVIDAVAYSRGGLVYREFAETLAPTALPGLVMGKAAFVACTNGGTHLADPQNWKTLVDLYTNAALLAANVVATLGGQALAGAIAADVIETLGQLVKYLSVVAIGAREVPGLADMEPGGTLVTSLNGAAPPAGALRRYFAITCDFDAEKVTPPATPELKLVLADPVIDQLLGDANDLVVDTGFMTQFGKRQDQLDYADIFSYGTTGDAYHTVYFAKEPTAVALAKWLP